MNYRIHTTKDKEAVKSYIDSLPEGKAYDVVIKLHREKRTIDQNRLLFLWLGCIANETGNDKDTLHEYFKQKFLGFEQRVMSFNREVTFISPTTTTLDTKQFTEYLNKIQEFASSELGIVLPLPEDAVFTQFYEPYKSYL